MSKKTRMRTTEDNKIEALSVFNAPEVITSKLEMEIHESNNKDISKKEKREKALLENILGIDKVNEQIKEKEKNKILYQIYDPETESEYYTYLDLHISGVILQAWEVIQKKMLEEVVIKQTIQVFYSYVSDKFKIMEFNLSKGVIIKTFSEDMLKDWLLINEQMAKDILKEKTLETYKNLMPTLINKIDSLENQVQQNRRQRTNLDEGYLDNGTDLLRL